MSQGSRPDRVADQIRSELASLLAREVHDPGHRLRHAHARAGHARPAAGARLLHRARRREGAQGHGEGARARGAVPPPADRLAAAAEARARAEVPLRRVDRRPGSHRAAPATSIHAEARSRDARRPTMTTSDAAAPRRSSTRSARASGSCSPRTRGPTATRSARSWPWRSRCARSARRSRVVNADPAPPPLHGVSRACPTSRSPTASTGEFDAAIIMECGDLARTGVAGLDRFFVINIDHHPGNTGYGADQLVRRRGRRLRRDGVRPGRALGVPLTLEIATHIYLAILTDTGSFHYSSISPRTFDICRAGARGRRRSGARRAQRLRQQQPGAAEAVRRGAERDADRPDGPHRRSSTSITRWRARPAAPTRTPKGSSTCR